DRAGEVGLGLPLQGELPGDDVLVLPVQLAFLDHEGTGDRAVGIDDTGEAVDERLFAFHDIPPNQLSKGAKSARKKLAVFSHGTAPAPLQLLHHAPDHHAIVMSAA